MSTEEKDILKDYDHQEGFGAFLYIIISVTVFLTFLGGTILYWLIESLIK